MEFVRYKINKYDFSVIMVCNLFCYSFYKNYSCYAVSKFLPSIFFTVPKCLLDNSYIYETGRLLSIFLIIIVESFTYVTLAIM